MKLKQWVKLIPLSVVASSLCLCAYASSDLEAIMKARNLSEKDILAAAKTYQPSGRRDEYMVFSSGGQSGQVIVYGVPSMRIYKYIAVFTRNPGKVTATIRNLKRYLQAARSAAGTSPGVTRIIRLLRNVTANTPVIISSSMTKPIPV